MVFGELNEITRCEKEKYPLNAVKFKQASTRFKDNSEQTDHD